MSVMTGDAASASRIRGARAPSYEALRPLKAARSDTFPVFSDLPDRLVGAKRHPDEVVAYVLATAAGYAYADGATLAMILARLGLEDCACQTVEQHVDAMLIETTAHIVQSADGRVVIVCFRGTVPMSGISWLNDLDVHPRPVALTFPPEHAGAVHGGFYRNVRAVRPDVIRCLDRALHGASVLDAAAATPAAMEALYVTGHSYGGAMATLLALMLRNEPAYAPVMRKLRAVYTFGAPMVASPALAKACHDDRRLGGRLFRYVYANDVVPQVPPRACGAFAHFGAELRYRPGHGWRPSEPRRQIGGALEMLASSTTMIARQLRLTHDLGFGASLYDHLPAGYIAALTPPDVTTEFGG